MRVVHKGGDTSNFEEPLSLSIGGYYEEQSI